MEPVAWAVFAENGNIRIWSPTSEAVEKMAEREGLTVIPLYTKDGMALAERLATDALTSLAGIVCTPAEGYLMAPHCLASDIGNLRKLEESATRRAISAEAGWKEALATIEQTKALDAEMLTTLKDIYRITCMTSKASHKEQTEIFQRMRRIIGAAAE